MMPRGLLGSALVLLMLGGCGSISGLRSAGLPSEELTSESPDSAGTATATAQRASVPSRAQQRFAAANAAIAAGDTDAARADLAWLIEQFPELSGPYLNLALVEHEAGNTLEAEPLFQAALEANPHNITAYNQYAIFLRQQGRFEDAEAAYLEALNVAPDHAGTHRNLGVLYDLYRGNAEQALAHYYRYQALTGDQDRVVAGWIIDLERRYSQIVQQERP